MTMRREAEADLVAEQKARIGEQRAAERDHLLLAAGELARLLVAPLLEDGKQPIDLVEADLALAADLPADAQIFLDGERGKSRRPSGTSATPLGDDRRRSSGRRDRRRRSGYRPSTRSDLADDGLEEATICRRRWRR